MNRIMLMVVVLAQCVVATAQVPKKAPQASVEQTLSAAPGLVDAKTVVSDLQVELKYATDDNFIGRNVYGDLKKCYLQKEAAQSLAKAAALLTKVDPGLRLLAYDCVRPKSVQKQMWEVVKGTPQQSYVANPHSKMGSIHNYGCAIDLTLAKADGSPLDMGTAFDHFGKEAQPRAESKLLSKGKLTHQQVANRLLLRRIMVEAGFYTISNEWWHFNCATSAQTRKRYKMVQ